MLELTPELKQQAAGRQLTATHNMRYKTCSLLAGSLHLGCRFCGACCG